MSSSPSPSSSASCLIGWMMLLLFVENVNPVCSFSRIHRIKTTTTTASDRVSDIKSLIFQSSSSSSSSSSLMMTVTSSSAAGTTTSQTINHTTNADDSNSHNEGWNSMTVTELKEELRQRKLKVSGKKQDLIDRLVQEQQQQQQGVETPTASSTINPMERRKQQRQQKIPLSMPSVNTIKVETFISDNDDNDDDDTGDGTILDSAADILLVEEERPQQQSPLELLIEDLYKQYPPLRFVPNKYIGLSDEKKEEELVVPVPVEEDTNTPIESIDETSSLSPLSSFLTTQVVTGLGDNDFRQTYHPMLRRQQQQQQQHDDDDIVTNNHQDKDRGTSALSGDMDLIFVGTASCSPSVTRGVSCTALRVNLAGSDAVQRRTTGTWLFDCGECTQVSAD